MTAGYSRFGQIFQIGVLVEYDALRHAGVVVTHLRQLGGRTGRYVGAGSAAQREVLFVAVAVDIGSSRRQYVYARHLWHALVEIERLLYDERCATVQLAQYRPPVVVRLETQIDVPRLAGRADGHGRRLCLIGAHLACCGDSGGRRHRCRVSSCHRCRITPFCESAPPAVRCPRRSCSW